MASLKEYRAKRHFGVTPEPSGERTQRATSARFVVQKHDATRLHYDFRLEMEGVLKSWAVPKGPSLNPADKRLAMHTEDHPLDYADFEGLIPEGQYGAGPVMVWDRGTFAVEGKLPAGEQFNRGEIKFALYGQKLRGSFVLVKLRRKDSRTEGRRGGREQPWLLIKHADEAADPAWKIEEHDGSVLSGRSLREIEEGLESGSFEAVREVGAAEIDGAREAKMPASLGPMLATLAETPFSHPDWLFEIKFDGIRALAWIQDGRLELRSRTGRIITPQYPELERLPDHLRVHAAILDGEIVVLDEKGHTNFERLQSRMNVAVPSQALLREDPVIYYLFDVLYADGYDLREAPLIERKNFLRRALEAERPFAYVDHQREKGKELFDLAREEGLEGIIGKRIGSFYTGRRSPDWMKFKITKELDAVIGGYTAPRGTREHFGALLLGLYRGRSLRFIGGVGTGFNQKTQRMVYEKLKAVEVERCPFDRVPQTEEQAYWVEPKVVARVKYGSWTEEQRLRAPVFLGLRDDCEAGECRFDIEAPAAAAPRPDSTRTAPPREPESAAKSRPRERVPALGERVLSGSVLIEDELFHGRAENVAIEIDGKRLRLTNLNKVYFPESGTTKRHLLAYYYRITDVLLPFLKDRPLVLRRYPNGITGKSFFQKDAGEHVPEWFETVTIHSEEERKDIRYFVASDRADLLYLTNLGCIDHNPWSSRRDDLDHPDYVFFDLDPSPETDFRTVVAVAQLVHRNLFSLGLKAFLKTSGATGFHVYVPLERGYSYEQVRMFAEIVGRVVGAEDPERVTQQRLIAKRPRGTVLIDAHQNALDRPLAAPYTVRAFPRAPVSTPITPDELRKTLRPERFNIKTVFARLEKQGDLWADFWKERQRLEPAIRKLDRA